MADIKISGLTIAANFAGDGSQEFGINDGGTSHKVTAGQIATYFPNGTRGAAWYAQITANQTPITAQVDVTGLTVTVTPRAAGRRFRLTCWATCSSSVVGDTVRLLLMEGATQLAYSDLYSSAAGPTVACFVSTILLPTNAAHTYKVQAVRAAGTGNMTVFGSTTGPGYILCEDIGT